MSTSFDPTYVTEMTVDRVWRIPKAKVCFQYLGPGMFASFSMMLFGVVDRNRRKWPNVFSQSTLLLQTCN